MVRLEVKNLTVKYNKTIAVKSLDFSIGNETVVFFGKSGCGKTSILKSILKVHDPNMKVKGSILLDGEAIEKGSGNIGMTIQGPVIPTWLTIYDLCKMGSRIRSYSPSKQKDRIISTLKSFGIEHLADKYPQNISGGEKQRAALAITLINEPKVLLLDEPTTFIDGTTRNAIWQFIENKIYPMSIPTIIVSHDPLEALTLGDRIFILSNPAEIIKEIPVPFPHPRSEDLYKNSEFWETKMNFIENQL